MPSRHRYAVMQVVLLVLIALTVHAGPAHSVVYHCKVTKKLDAERTYPQSMIDKYKYSVKIEELGSSSYLSRCGYSPSARKMTCDRYKVDKTVFDANVKVKKYYVFASQFDVQLYQTLFFVENNGRGGIAFGKCVLHSP